MSKPHDYDKQHEGCQRCADYRMGALSAHFGFAEVVAQYVRHQREDLGKLGQIAGVVEPDGVDEAAQWN